MRSNQETVLGWLAISEGGYVNHPKDPGGATNKGVTQRVFTAWLEKHGAPRRDVRTITTTEAKTIFLEQYFDPVKFNDLPSGLDYAVADYSVNSGPVTAAKALQGVLRDLGHFNVAADGHIGVVTLAAVKSEPDPGLLVSAICAQRMRFLRQLSTWDTFGKGWSRRVEGEIEGAQETDTGVLDRALRMAHSLPIVGTVKPAAGKAMPPEPKPSIFAIFAAVIAGLLAILRRKP